MWSVRLQVYTKPTSQISMKLGWKMSLKPEQTPLNFGSDPDKENYFLTSFNVVTFSTFLIITQETVDGF